MKATQLPWVIDLITRRQKLHDMADAAELGLINLSVGVGIADDAMKAVVRPPILVECRARIAGIDRELAALGVEID